MYVQLSPVRIMPLSIFSNINKAAWQRPIQLMLLKYQIGPHLILAWGSQLSYRDMSVGKALIFTHPIPKRLDGCHCYSVPEVVAPFSYNPKADFSRVERRLILVEWIAPSMIGYKVLNGNLQDFENGFCACFRENDALSDLNTEIFEARDWIESLSTDQSDDSGGRGWVLHSIVCDIH